MNITNKKLGLILIMVLGIAFSMIRNVKAQDLPRLSQLGLTMDDLRAVGEINFSGFLLTQETVWIADRTIEFNGHCPEDCSKTIWHTRVRTYLPDGYRWFTIILLRFTTTDQAEYSSQSLFQQFHNPDDPEFYDYSETVDWQAYGLSTETFAVYDRSYVLSTTQGSVQLLLTMRLFGFRDLDGFGEVSELATFASYQLDRLKAAGYP